MKMKIAILWILSIALLANASDEDMPIEDNGRYLILLPRRFIISQENIISVSMFNTEVDENLTFEIFEKNVTYLTFTKSFLPDSNELVNLTLPSELKGIYSAKLRIMGTGAVEFNATTSIWLSKDKHVYTISSPTIQAQMDRSFYKRNDIVRIRFFGLNKKLTTVQTPMDIHLYDSNDNMLRKWTNEQSMSGVVSKHFQLSDNPLLGTWHFKVKQGDDEALIYFKVREYTLPKFEVNIEATSHLVDFSMGYLYLLNEVFDVNVTAQYTFGKPVTGEMELNISLGHRNEFKIFKVMNISGFVNLKIPFRNLFDSHNTITVPRYRSYCNIPNIVIRAKVTEALTQKSMTASEVYIKSESAPITVTHSTNRNMKYGLPNYLEVFVKRVDGKPLKESDRAHPLKVDFSPNIIKEFEIPADGKVRVLIDVPENPSTNLRIEIVYTGVYNEKEFILKSTPYLSRYAAVNNTNIEATVPEKYYKVGDEVEIIVDSTHPISSATLLIMKDNEIVMNKFMAVNDERAFKFHFLATESLIPNVDFLITCISTDGTFATDGGKIPITVSLKNTITANFSASEGRAGDEVKLNVQTSPNSVVYMMAIDRSIELVEKPDYFTEEDILSIVGGKPGAVTKVNSYNPKAILRNFGFDIMTNFPGLESLSSYPYGGNRRVYSEPRLSTSFMSKDGSSEGKSNNIVKVRSFFPETWIWSENAVDENGHGSIAATVPDSITRWVANGFSVGPDGVAALKKPAEFYSYQPFFMFLDFPKSVIREESFPLKVTVFNYLKTDQEVKVTLLPSDELNPKEIPIVKTVPIKSNGQVLVTFDVSLKQVGTHSLNVKAESSEISDEIHKDILVKPEGITKFFNKAFMLNVTGEEPLVDKFSLSLDNTSANIVPNSVRIEVSAIGDIMAQTDVSATGLVRKPSGCGEQNMINFSPNIMIYQYLNESNRLAEDLKKQLIEYTQHGYQNQLRFQHKTGSYSAFGASDSRGSTWLTAFVLRCFVDAKKHMPEVYIDDNVLSKAASWLIKQQTEIGLFRETGQVLHKAMQGGASEGKAMTAYILIALLEYRDLIASNEGLAKTMNATEEAITLSALYLNTVPGNMYSKAVAMYAMALMGDDTMFEELEAELNNVAVIEGGFKYWKTQRTKHSWGEVDEIVDEPNIEMSSYILLAYAKRRETEKGLPILRWLVSKRSSLGGYDSTQSTVVAFKALATFAALINSCCDKDVQIEMKDNTDYTYTFPIINYETSTILYQHVMPPDTTSITFTASGKGFVLVQVAWQYNILKEEASKSNIESTVEAECINNNKFALEICNSWLVNETSGMALIEVQLPSGFAVDKSKYVRLPYVKRIETDDSKINIYLDEIPTEKFCIKLEAEKWHEVENRKVSHAVTTSLFYDPGESTVKTYEIDCSAESSG